MSLAVIFVVGFFGLGMALTIATVALVGLNKNYNTNSGNQTFYTAESAVKESTYQYIKSKGSIILDGDVYAQDINNSTDNVIVDESDPIFTYITATATNTLTNRQVKYKLERIPGSMTFSYAIFASGELTMHGGAGLDIDCVDGTIICNDFPLGASVFSNEDITLHGNPRIEGGAYSAGEITGNDHFIDDGLHDSNVGIKSISVPTIDLQPYHDEATASSTLFSTPAQANTYLASHSTGTVFIEQDTGTTAIQHKDLDGTLVTQNSLDLSQGTYGTTDFSRAALIVEGGLDIGSNTIINGIVYVEGTTKFVGNGIINGVLISKGGIEVEGGGSIEINYNPDISQEFQNIPGLDETPIITNWQEQ